MIPSSNMWSNLRCVIWSHSGDRRRALTETGSPVVGDDVWSCVLISLVVTLGWGSRGEVVTGWRMSQPT